MGGKDIVPGFTLEQAHKVLEAVREAARGGIADTAYGFMLSARDGARGVLEDAGLNWYPRDALALLKDAGAVAPDVDESGTLQMVIAELGELLLLGIKVPSEGDFDETKRKGAAHLFELLLDIRRRMWQDLPQSESAPATGP